jgi:preprotein translocase subunit SecD
MSSDYIDRLRHELLRAGASAQPWWFRPARLRRALPALVTAGAVALVAAALLVTWPAVRTDERPVEPAAPGEAQTYRVEPSGAAEQTAHVLRERLAAAGVAGAAVSVAGDSLTITAPPAAHDAVTALIQPGHVGFYDWERSVLGPGGKPAPTDPETTGNPDAGRGAAVTKAEAEARAAAAPDGRVVRAENGDGWFALGGGPALTDADVDSADSMVIQATQHPIVVVELTPQGQAAFAELTRELAHRGASLAEPGSGIEANQHLAIVIDDRIVAVPFIDFHVAPNGIDGAEGAQISGNLTEETARQMASILDSGPLPGTLTSTGG